MASTLVMSPNACSEQRTPVGLSNHPALTHMAAICLCSRSSRRPLGFASSCPSDVDKGVADGTASELHPWARVARWFNSSGDPRTHLGPKGARPLGLVAALEGRLPSPRRTKCDCARRDYVQGTLTDGGFDSPQLHAAGKRCRGRPARRSSPTAPRRRLA